MSPESLPETTPAVALAKDFGVLDIALAISASERDHTVRSWEGQVSQITAST